MPLRELVSEVRQSIYAVLVEWNNPSPGIPKIQVLGTAFSVSSEGHFITANHVVQPSTGQPPGPQVGTNDKIHLAQMQHDGTTATISGPLTTLAQSVCHDYAIIHLQTSGSKIQKYLELDFSSRFEGEEVAICGYPLASTQLTPENNSVQMNLNIRVASGIISSQRIENGSKLIEVDFPILSGNSGGPLFSLRTGKVLAIAHATYSLQNASGASIGHLGLTKDIRNATSDLKLHLPHF